MKILLIHLHFNTPYQGGPQRSYYIASELTNLGCQCELITAHNSSSYLVQDIDGFRIHFLPVLYKNEFGFLRRIFAFWKFNRLAVHLASKLDFDLAYCISTPLTIGSIGVQLKRSHKRPFVFEIGDLWPDAPIQMGVIKNKWFKKYLRDFEKRIYNEASGIVSLSPSITSELQKRTSQPNIITVPNFSDIDFFSEVRSNPPFQFFKDSRFIVSACGAIGKANELEFMVELARYCEKHAPEIGFVIMGEGAEKPSLEKMAEGLSNMKFLPLAPKKYVKEVLQSSQAVYISYKQIPILETGSPNKFFDGLAAGKLIITNFGGWIPDLIESNECGFRYDPNHPIEFIEKLRPYAENWEVKELQVRANSLSLAREFELKTNVDKLANWLKLIPDLLDQ